MITREQLLEIMPLVNARAAVFLQPLNDAMDEFEINTPRRQAAFLAQIAHESGQLLWLRELWGPTPQQLKYEPPGELASRLGNTEPSDGKRFRGRGLIQITGRANYAGCSEGLFADRDFLLRHPEALEAPAAACRSAAWWWQQHGLNALADVGAAEFRHITRIINGGLNGIQEREAYLTRAEAALGINMEEK